MSVSCWAGPGKRHENMLYESHLVVTEESLIVSAVLALTGALGNPLVGNGVSGSVGSTVTCRRSRFESGVSRVPFESGHFNIASALTLRELFPFSKIPETKICKSHAKTEEPSDSIKCGEATIASRNHCRRHN